MNNLASYLSARYNQLGGVDDLNEAIVLGRDALSLCPPEDEESRLTPSSNLANHLSTRYEQLGEIDDLNEAIILSQDILSLCPPGHPSRSTSLSNFAVYLSTRYDRLGEIDDLNEAIVLGQEVLSLCPPGHPGHSVSLNNFASYLSTRYKQLGRIDDLNEAIALGRDALLLCPPGHLSRSTTLSNLASRLSTRYSQLGEVGDLHEAIGLCRDALSLRSPGHPDRSTSLNDLASYLSLRYKELGDIDDLNGAITLSQDALSLYPPGHPFRSTSLINSANYLSTRYDQFGAIDDLNQAIALGRDALSLCPPGHPDRSTSLANLAEYLFTRYEQLGRIEDLGEAITLSRDALLLRPPGHPHRSISLSNVASHLSARYDQLGAIDDLNQAVALGRDALSLRPLGHPNRSTSLNNLAYYLFTRYRQLGATDDLDETIVLSEDALSLCPPGHTLRPGCLGNLATYLNSRYDQLGSIDDLNQAIDFARDVLSLRPPGHPARLVAEINLALSLYTRYIELRGIDDLDEAIVLEGDVLSVCPPGHPLRSTSLNNIAGYLSTRYEHFGRIDDLNEALALAQAALSLCPPGHPNWSLSLKHLAGHLYVRFTRLGQTEDQQAVFSLYAELEHLSQTFSSSTLSAAKAWVDAAEESHHTTISLAYETALRFLVDVSVTLPPLPQHLALLKSFSSSLAVDAFSACLRNESPTKAVELLEQGRGVFWSQLTRLRSPLDDVIASGPKGKTLADEFTRLTSLIRMTLRSSTVEQHDRVYHLNLELQKVVSKIRELAGHSRFLLPSLFSDLQHAATDGPVIIVNASKYGCDALVVFADKDPVHIPLPVTKEDVRGLSSNLHTLRDLASQKRMDVTTGFKSFLRELWDRVVSHIVIVLRATCPRESRIWWCPTAEFSLLPLHAAIPYRKGEESVSDLFISSYTTTLTALTRARRPGIFESGFEERRRFLAIGQAKSPGFTKLHSIRTELENIQRHVEGVATFMRVEGSDAHISGITNKLSENEWVHFACHGVSNQEWPFESAFALRDGMFTIQRIIRCNLENPEFAYLSACETTVGDEESPDEVIHLASAMQFAGFRSVVGTTWSVADSPATKVASTFYNFMVDESGCLDYTRAAWALWKTLRTVDIPMDQRILYIHLGA